MVLNGIFDPGEFHQFPIHVAHALELLSKFSSHIAYLSFKLAFFLLCSVADKSAYRKGCRKGCLSDIPSYWRSPHWELGSYDYHVTVFPTLLFVVPLMFIV